MTGGDSGAVSVDAAFPDMIATDRSGDWHANQPTQASDPWAGIMSTDPGAMRLDSAFD
jgi:hypothetical protein